MLKEQLPNGLTVRCQPKGWMTNEFTRILAVVWNRGQGCSLENWGMPMIVSLKGHLTPEIKATVTGSSMNTDLVVNMGGMTLQLQVL